RERDDSVVGRDEHDARRRVRPLHRARAQARRRGRIDMELQRASAIVERELRKFMRTPALIIMTLFMPVLNLVVLGNAFGGRVRHLNVAVVDEDGGPAARRVIEAIYSLQMNGDVVRPINYPDEQLAARDVRD